MASSKLTFSPRTNYDHWVAGSHIANYFYVKVSAILPAAVMHHPLKLCVYRPKQPTMYVLFLTPMVFSGVYMYFNSSNRICEMVYTLIIHNHFPVNIVSNICDVAFVEFDPYHSSLKHSSSFTSPNMFTLMLKVQTY